MERVGRSVGWPRISHICDITDTTSKVLTYMCESIIRIESKIKIFEVSESSDDLWVGVSLILELGGRGRKFVFILFDYCLIHIYFFEIYLGCKYIHILLLSVHIFKDVSNEGSTLRHDICFKDVA